MQEPVMVEFIDARMENWPVIIFRITQIGRRIHNILAEDCKKNKLTVTQHHIVMECSRMGMDCSYEELIKATCFNKSTITRGIQDLERMKMLASYTDVGDPRYKRVRLIKAGKAYAAMTIKNALKGEGIYTADLTTDEVSRLHRYMNGFYTKVRQPDPSDVLSTEWPVIGHYSMNLLKYLDWICPLFRADGREINQKHILINILHNGGEISYKKLERKLRMEQSVVARQIEKLSALGLVESYASEADLRIKYAALTQEGKQAADRVLEAFRQLEDEGCRGFTRAERQEFRELLHRILAAIDTAES